MSRSVVDAVRSVKRRVAEVLPGFEVRLADERGLMQPPSALVGLSGDVNTQGGTGYVMDTSAGITVFAYPVPPEREDSAALDSMVLAERLLVGFRGGLSALRVPLMDYTGVGIDEAATRRTGVLRLAEVAVNTMADPQEPTRHVVIMNARMSWRRSLLEAVSSDANLVEALRVRFVVEKQPQSIYPLGVVGADAVGAPRVNRV